MKGKKMMALLLGVSVCFSMLGCGNSTSAESKVTESAEAVSSQPPVQETVAKETETQSLGKVSCGIHQGGSANCAAFLAKQLGYDQKYGFDLELVVTTGPNVYSSITADEMDVGFLGNGMAWHYFEQDSKMSLLTIDNLTDDDKLLMRKELGYAGDGKESLDTFYVRLPGTTIALDLTTTPGVFWKSLVSAINEGREEPIWYEDVEGAYPEKGSNEKKVNILNTANANITAAMEDPSIDGCICFGSVKKGLQENGNYTTVSSTRWHLGDTITPSQYCVNTAWAEKNPELLQAFMNALIDAFDYRADEGNWDECINMAMKFDQLEYKDYDMTAGYYPTHEDLKNWFGTEDGIGYTYLENIRNSHMGSNGLTDENMKSIDDIFLKDYLLNACEK